MKRLEYIAIGLLAVGALAVVGRYIVKAEQDRVQVAAEAAKTSQRDADQKVMDQRVADEQDAAKSTADALKLEQGKTADLNTQLAGLRGELSDTKKALTDAKLTPRHTSAPVAGACPGSPFDSDDFERMWNGR